MIKSSAKLIAKLSGDASQLWRKGSSPAVAAQLTKACDSDGEEEQDTEEEVVGPSGGDVDAEMEAETTADKAGTAEGAAAATSTGGVLGAIGEAATEAAGVQEQRQHPPPVLEAAVVPVALTLFWVMTKGF